MKFFVLTIFVSAFSPICTDQPDVSGQVSINGTEKKSDLSQQEDIIRFRRINEPNEKAFTVLIPDDWKNTGGIFRVDPNRQGSPAQSIAAKLDFTLQKDKLGSIMMR